MYSTVSRLTYRLSACATMQVDVADALLRLQPYHHPADTVTDIPCLIHPSLHLSLGVSGRRMEAPCLLRGRTRLRP